MVKNNVRRKNYIWHDKANFELSALPTQKKTTPVTAMGKLAKIKTTENSSSVEQFINDVKEEQKRKDSFVLLDLVKTISREDPKRWGSSIIGFGKLIYKSPASGREVEWFKVGFSPRKASITIYLMNLQLHESALKKLGKHKQGGGCLYINKLEDVDMEVLKEMITATIANNEQSYK